MKNSIIWKLVADGSCYADDINPHDNKEYDKCWEELYNIAEKLCEDMPGDERRKTLNKLSMAQCGLEALTAEEYFIEGFKLGLRLAAENFL